MAGVKLGSMEIVLGLDLKNFSRQMKGIRRKFGRLSGQLKMAGRDLTQALTLPLAAIGVGATKLAVDWETSFANVHKTVKGTESEMAELSAGLRKMSTELPMTAGGLASIAEEAGRLGIEQRNIISFTETIVKLAETSTMMAEEAAVSLARFANITQLPQKNIDRLATSLTVLGSEFATSETQIMEMGLRIAATGKLIGLSEADILGLSAAMTAVGIQAEMGGTAMSKVLIGISQAASEGGKKLDTMAAIAGMAADTFKQKFETDAAGAVTVLVKGLGKLDKAQAFKAVDALGFSADRTMRMLLTLAGSGDLLTKTLDRSATAWAENTALNELAAKRFGTTGAMLTVLKNRFVDLGRQLGESLIPALKGLMQAFEGFIPTIKGWIDSFTALSTSTKTTIIALTAVLAAIGPLLIGLGMLSGSLAAVASMMTLVSAHPIVAMITVVAALVVGIVGYNVVAAKMSAITGTIGDKMRESEQSIKDYQAQIKKLTRIEEIHQEIRENEIKQAAELVKSQNQFSAITGKQKMTPFYKALARSIRELRSELGVLEDSEVGLIQSTRFLTKAEAEWGIQDIKTQRLIDETEEKVKNLRKAYGMAGREVEFYNAVLAEEMVLQKELIRIAKDDPTELNANALKNSRLRYNELTTILAEFTAGQIDAGEAGQKLTDILEQQRKKAGETKTAWEEWKDTIGKTMEDATAFVNDFTFNVMQRFTDGIGDAFAQVLIEGKSFGEMMQSLWKDIAKMIISRLISIAAQMVIFSLIQKHTGLTGAKDTISNKAGETYAAGFASVMAALPFPLNIAMAPVVGAGQAALMTAAALGLTGLAQGGIISSPQLVLAGEAGPEAIVPLDRLGSFGGGGQVINLHIDGELITQEVVHGMPAFIDARLGGI